MKKSFNKAWVLLLTLALLTAFLTTCALASPAGEVIYVSQLGGGNGSSADSPTTLGSAVNKAVGGETIIVLDDITVGSVITLDKSVTIKGQDKPTLTAGDKQMFSLGSNVSVTFENLVFDGSKGNYSNSGTFYGGAISADGRTTSFECENVTLSVVDCEFKDFEAYAGGAICFHYTEDGTINVTGSNFANNKAYDLSGGAICFINCKSNTLSVNTSKFTGNCSSSHGGAIACDASYNTDEGDFDSLTITNCMFEHNSVDSGNRNHGGGAVAISDYDGGKKAISISGCKFNENRSGTVSGEGEVSGSAMGGAVFINATRRIELANNTFTGNQAGGHGGAMHIACGESETTNVTVNGCTFDGNVSGGQGGAINLGSGGLKTTINNVLFESNTTDLRIGNAIAFFKSSNAVTDSAVYPTNGAAFYNNGAEADGVDRDTIFVNSYSSSSDSVVRITDYMLDGTRLNWKFIGKDENGDYYLFDADRDEYSVVTGALWTSGAEVYLDGDTNAPSYTESAYSNVFKNNHASYGGAISNYGSLTIGTPGADINVNKVWEDELDTHKAVTVNLVRESDKAELDELTLGPDSWSGTFYGFPTNIGYTVTEDPVEGYTAQIMSTENGVTITNTSSVSVSIVPADITVYVGGDGYEGAVDGDGTPLEEDNGFPVPGFTISAEGLDDFDPAEAVLTYQNDGSYYSWDIVPYDGVEGASHRIYRFEPQSGSNPHVKMRFWDKDLNTYVDSDSFDIEGSLGKDLKMEVYGENIPMEHVKLVYGDAEYAVTSGNGTLKVRSTTESEDYGSVVERERDVPRGEPGVVVPDGAKYYINNKPVEVVDTSGVKLLFDDIIEQNSASVSNTQLLINRADEVLGGSSDSRRYEAKYLDLVDTSNGNAWVAADGAVTVYWPLPAGTGWNTNFTLLRFDGLNRETSVGHVENLIATCNVTPIRVENTGTHIKFTVEKAGFAPFILVWDEYNTPITPIPEPDNSPVGLNTEDHVAYIIGYEDGTVRPGANITRAEVATIFFRLLTDETRESYWSQSSGFTDVASGAWYNNAVSTLTRAGILDGYEDGSFRPNASITRAEFTKIAVSFFKHVGGASSNPFNDVPDSAWYAEFVKAAAELGLIDGYEDGTFRPNAPITRAEACTIVNRTLGRAPDKDNLLPEHEMLTWPDNSRDAWYYAQIQEATNSHDYQWLGAIELWTAKLAERDWDALEKEWSNAYSAPGGEVAR